ncbi:hypothetical protein [Hydrotalea sandarakina]|mgnify:CR=1 FL=1|jgi:hypothetical protein|uniref:Uncharacterized protein n=1 Tax=Hydrotalea sandarakina TaxID=1004304 RepID=A0A2W7RQ67_9BACT|nr:hypothetical protein [Hydrotalea sandarakina]PZX62973.1 hypothetical protein LX80_01668 [Hydrotalea sandarakina]
MLLEQKKKNRFLFLNCLYESSNGDTGAMFDMWEVGKELKLNSDETSQIVDYLIGEHLIESRALGGIIGLTHWGIKEVEQAIENPSKPTEHFLPLNIINIGTMTNSTLQQGTTNSTINFNYNTQTAVDIEKIVSQLNDIKDSLNLSNELQSELLSEIQTIEIQKKSSKPKSIIITESLKSIRTILESVAGNAMTPVIIDQISKLIGQ